MAGGQGTDAQRLALALGQRLGSVKVRLNREPGTVAVKAVRLQLMNGEQPLIKVEAWPAGRSVVLVAGPLQPSAREGAQGRLWAADLVRALDQATGRIWLWSGEKGSQRLDGQDAILRDWARSGGQGMAVALVAGRLEAAKLRGPLQRAAAPLSIHFVGRNFRSGLTPVLHKVQGKVHETAK